MDFQTWSNTNTTIKCTCVCFMQTCKDMIHTFKNSGQEALTSTKHSKYTLQYGKGQRESNKGNKNPVQV